MSNDNNFKNFSTRQKRLVFFFIIIFGVNCQNIFAQKPCGKLLGGLSDDCIVIRGDEHQRLKAKENMILYPEDLIIQKSNVRKINFRLSPFAQKYFIHSNAIWIVYTPQEKKNQPPKFLRWLENLKAAVHLSQNGTSRNINDEDINPKHLYPKPGWRASLLPGESVLFSWESRLAKSLVIIDSQGKLVFRKKLNSETSIELNANEIGMEPFIKYYWGIEIEGIVDIRIDYELKLLDGDIVRIVKIGFEKIEKEALDPTHRELKKAAYLQFISDIYGNDAELYWKSGQILAEIDRDKLDNQPFSRYQLLLKNYRDHHRKSLGDLNGCR